MRYKHLILVVGIFFAIQSLHAQQTESPENENSGSSELQFQSNDEDSTEKEAAEEEADSARTDEAALNEDPEAQRRARIEEQPELRHGLPEFDFYGSVRLHAINDFNDENASKDLAFGDGASRVGVRGDWQMSRNWYVFGRAELGFDVLEHFTEKGAVDNNDGGLSKRLLYAGVDSDRFAATYGKNWSSYYKIAGMADRFSIFGGGATGVYNALTDGGSTGTGRADDVIQVRLYTSSLKVIKIKPFNINMQYQQGQPIPAVQNRNYGQTWGASAWLESQNDFGIGLAYHRANIANLDDPLIEAAGIDGDATALAVSFRTYGEHWYAALVVARHENIETTDKLKYIEGYGVELYSQWQFKDRWWLVAGYNYLDPDNDDEDGGKYLVSYGVLGMRYTLDSFNRMLYAEYRIDQGILTSGIERDNEFTIGIRWDFGY